MEKDNLPPWHAEKYTGVEMTKSKNSLRLKLGVLFGILVLALGVIAWLLYSQNATYEEEIKVVGDTTPYAVEFTSIGNDTFTIEWKTKIPTIGFIKYGLSAGALDLIGQSEERSVESKSEHKVTVDGLDSGEKYYVEIHSNALGYGDDNGPLEVKTLD